MIGATKREVAHGAKCSPVPLVMLKPLPSLRLRFPCPRRVHAKGRSYRIFRYNTFHHIGHISTLAQPTNRFNPGCYALMYDWLLPAEVFNEKDCPDDDIWPCREASKHAPAFFPEAKIQWSGSQRKALSLGPIQERVLQPLSMLPQLEGGGAVRGGGSSDHSFIQSSSATITGSEIGSRPAGTGRVPVAAALGQQSSLVPFAAWQGESCTRACARWQLGGRCSKEGLRQLNVCDAMRVHLECDQGCEESMGTDQPARVARNAPEQSLPGKCLVNTGAFDCAGQHPLTTRLCACEAGDQARLQ